MWNPRHGSCQKGIISYINHLLAGREGWDTLIPLFRILERVNLPSKQYRCEQECTYDLVRTCWSFALPTKQHCGIPVCRSNPRAAHRVSVNLNDSALISLELRSWHNSNGFQSMQGLDIRFGIQICFVRVLHRKTAAGSADTCCCHVVWTTEQNSISVQSHGEFWNSLLHAAHAGVFPSALCFPKTHLTWAHFPRSPLVRAVLWHDRQWGTK